ncbi:MAG: hypothetical protein ACOCRO_05155 [Halanaerobiales bacterium]
MEKAYVKLVANKIHVSYNPEYSSDFWNKLASIIPDYKERQEWLKINQRCLVI